MSTTATDLITDAYLDLGIFQPGEPVPAADLNEGLRRLNHLVASLRTQRLMAVAVERDVFQLTANVASYSIGPGGDFDVPRPLTVDGAGLLLNGLNAARTVTITRSGTTATVALTAHGFTVGLSVLIDGAIQTDYNGLQSVTSVTTNTFTYVVNGAPVSPATGTITAASEATNAVEIPRTILTDDAYQAIAIKTLSSSLFTAVYYNATQPLGTIWLWPTPNTTSHQLVLYLQMQFTGFATLSTAYSYPDMPGYVDLLEYNLCARLALTHGVQTPPEVLRMAAEALALVKRQNWKMVDAAVDGAWTHDHRGYYNIQTGEGGGA